MLENTKHLNSISRSRTNMNKHKLQVYFLQSTVNTLLGLFFLFLSNAVQAQTIYIENITLSGNKKTKERTVLRELNFQKGDTLELATIDDVFAQNKLFLINTGLFTEVMFSLKNTQMNRANIEIQLTESLYILPVPIFELADRNFNVWWQEMNHDLSRTNYGLRLYHLNLTGRKDRLKVAGQWGYTRKAEIDYQFPGVNKAQTIGLAFNILLTRNREIAYRTRENKLLFDRSDDTFLFRRFRTSVRAFYRPELFETHNVELFYHQNGIDDYVKNELNPDFFGNNKTKLSHFSLEYRYTSDKRNLRIYPTGGNYIAASLKKDGLGITDDRNALNLFARYAHYIPYKKRFHLEAIIEGRYAFLRQQQPYYDYKALGFETSYVRGYEFYVIDGLDYFFQKTSLRFEIFNKKINFGKLSPFKALRVMPTRVYLSLNNDFGYANDPFYNINNPISNKMLWGRGVGLDIMVYYALVVQMEYSFNHLGERGVFLHIRAGFN